MRALPGEFDARTLPGLLVDGWGFEPDTVEYAAVGGGSYHWVVSDRAGSRAFVNLDDLDTKPWLGDSRDEVFAGLTRAFDTAVALRRSGHEFVVAPLPADDGASLARIGTRYTIALFPFVDGQAGRFGAYEPGGRAAIVAMLAELHGATPVAASVARRADLALPGRSWLEAALAELNEPWLAGPFSEPARHLLDRHASDVAELLTLHDRLSADVARRSGDWVVTHGEPHAANVMQTAEGRVLVDWDTVALAPPERDLWMLVADSTETATIYREETGRQPDPVAVDFFRLTWDLGDLASFINLLRSPHRDDADTAKALDGVAHCVTVRDQWAKRI